MNPSALMTAATVGRKVLPPTARVLTQNVAPALSRTTGLSLTTTRIVLLCGAGYVGYVLARAALRWSR